MPSKQFLHCLHSDFFYLASSGSQAGEDAVICISRVQLPVLFEPWFRRYSSPSSVSTRWAECCYSRAFSEHKCSFWPLAHCLQPAESLNSLNLIASWLLLFSSGLWICGQAVPCFLMHTRIGKDPSSFFSDHIWEGKSNSTSLEHTALCQKGENLVLNLWGSFSSFNKRKHCRNVRLHWIHTENLADTMWLQSEWAHQKFCVPEFCVWEWLLIQYQLGVPWGAEQTQFLAGIPGVMGRQRCGCCKLISKGGLRTAISELFKGITGRMEDLDKVYQWDPPTESRGAGRTRFLNPFSETKCSWLQFYPQTWSVVYV